MNRRSFIVTATASLALPSLALAAGGTKATPEEVVQALADGKTVFVDFYTDWCTTCAAQTRAINALRKENPAYEEAITFLAVDWDQHANSDLAKALKIPRRSTLVVLKGGAEFGRIVAGTSKDQIRELMDAGLAAASS